MERGSDLHGPRKDDSLKQSMQGMIRGNRPDRAEEWREPEPPADDDPERWQSSPTGGRPEIGAQG
jgi:hypothetical protein